MGALSARILPHGWRDFGRQLAIWLGFLATYQLARGIADRGTDWDAISNARVIMDLERSLHLFVERDIQWVVLSIGGPLVDVLNWTYWLAQFAVLGVALLWIYLFRNDAFARVRNWVLTANMLGLVGYALVPTAPPRIFTDEGFVDSLGSAAALNLGSALFELAANPYAAMPSLHAADALIVGFALATLVRSPVLKLVWTLWPTWVWFTVMATGNHFWLDVAAGVGVALLAGAMLKVAEGRRAEVGPAVASTPRW